ncbi:MAG: hypothetical protein M1819_003911 [Sarea resinae]|nr:MAG: hypothetical protein M1819_003911 [Sarea resinae]
MAEPATSLKVPISQPPKMEKSRLMNLPAEIRLKIYRHLMVDDDVLRIRSEDPSVFALRKPLQRHRTTYWIMSGRFRGRCLETTYCLSNNPDLHPAILAVSRKSHQEALPVLYSENTFDFYVDVEAVSPFLKDRTSDAVAAMKRIRIVKRPLPFDREYDRLEWAALCSVLSEATNLSHLELGIFAGRPSTGWDGVQTYSKLDFQSLVKHSCADLEWARDLVAVKGLQNLDVKAIVHRCPPPVSSAMAFFIAFSASIESGFAAYLASEMVDQSL